MAIKLYLTQFKNHPKFKAPSYTSILYLDISRKYAALTTSFHHSKKKKKLTTASTNMSLMWETESDEVKLG